MATKVILNPKADLGNGVKYLEPIREAMEEFDDIDIVLTVREGHARELAEDAAREGYDVIIAAGGDGTVNEVVNGIMFSEVEGITMGVIPLGTGNDFAYFLGVEADVNTAVAKILAGNTRVVDLALLEDDRDRRLYFANNMGAGFDANVVIRTAEITAMHGFLKYLAGVFTTLARDFRPLNLHVRYDEEELTHQKVLFLYLGIGSRGGGGFMLTPDASNTDDRIDSCTVAMLGRLRALSLINAAIKGTHVHSTYVTMRKNKQIVIHSSEAMPIQVDGEVYAWPEDDVHHLIITSLPAALRVFV